MQCASRVGLQNEHVTVHVLDANKSFMQKGYDDVYLVCDLIGTSSVVRAAVVSDVEQLAIS
jgi:hypothetical protein